MGLQDEYQQQQSLHGMEHTHLEERVVPQRKIWMLKGEREKLSASFKSQLLSCGESPYPPGEANSFHLNAHLMHYT